MTPPAVAELSMTALSNSLVSAGLDRLADPNLVFDSDESRLIQETVLDTLCFNRDNYCEYSDGRSSTDIVDNIFYGVHGVSQLAIRHF